MTLLNKFASRTFLHVYLAFLFNLVLFCFASSANSLVLNYELTITDPSSSLLHVKLAVAGSTGNELVLARQIPYPANPPIQGLTIKDGSAVDLPFRIDSHDKYEAYVIGPIDSGILVVEYDINLAFIGQESGGAKSYWSLDQLFGAVESQVAILQPSAQLVTSCQVIPNLPENWEFVSRLIQEVDNADIFRANVDDKVFAKNSELYHGFLFWGPMLFGEFNRFTRNIGGVEVEVVFYGNFAEEEQIYENLFALFSYHSQNIRPLNLPANSPEKIRYIYALLGDDSKIVHSGDHIYGQYTPFNIEDLNESRYREIAHIMAHTWFSTHYRLLVDETAEEFGETTIQFYALRAVSETAVWSSAQVDEHLLIWYEDYRDFILGTQYDVALFPSENWDGFSDEPLESNYSYSLSNTIWYEKGPLAFWVIDRKIRQVSSDSIDFIDVWQYLAMHNPHVEENSGNSYQELLEVTNFLTGYDFAPIFEAYISGNDPLPLQVSEGVLLWRDAEIPEISLLSDIGLVRHHLKWGLSELDTDGDGLSDELEALLPTYFDKEDSDEDGFSDREEYGLILDGKAGERIGAPIISDVQGDTTFPATGGDIADIHSGVFIDENFKRHLYFTMSYHDASPNPELWYELELGYGNGADRLQYRYEQGKSTLYDDNNGQISELTDGSTGYLKERLEAVINFEHLNESAYKVFGMTRHFAHDFAISGVDTTSSRSVSLQPSMFVTDPMKKDTDGDTIIDSVDNCPIYHNPEQLECDPVIADNDIDGDKRVTQGDVIFGLQLAAGEQHSVTITQHNDANGDGIIGLAEAIGLLQQLAKE